MIGAFGEHPLISGVALALACAAAAILIWYLWRRPPLSAATKVLLLLGIGVFPIGSALTGNVVGFEHTKERSFCASCHVMLPFTRDSANPNSTSLAARHARNGLIGDENCYACHRDYGAFGVVFTKIGGMRHVWEYYTKFRYMTLAQALPKIHLYEPFPNSSCTHCHSTRVPDWLSIGDHKAALPELRSGRLSCASAGCHGPVHVFSTPGKKAPAGAGAGKAR